MLTIIDLHREEEISSSSMAEISGGANVLAEIGGALVKGIGDTLKGLGLQDAANVAYAVSAVIVCP
jgi:hypothetical protein